MRIKIYIPSVKVNDSNRRTLFILIRPFLTANYEWKNDNLTFERWGISMSDYGIVSDIKKADLVFIPIAINEYFIENNQRELFALNDMCRSLNIKAYGYISGDFGEIFQGLSNIIYLRMGGFKSQLTTDKGFPVSIGDKLIFKKFIPTNKSQNPVVGFCGHANLSLKKKFLENFKFYRENMRRFLMNATRRDYEVIFPSAFHRATILSILQKSQLIESNFVYRRRYRAGAITVSEREKTTNEYFENISNSDYVLCVRGVGNFSVRLYETLMMGKIPVFINTDCLLPFEEIIDWKNHVVWVEWKDRKNIPTIIYDFHMKLSNDEFLHWQIKNRELWKERLSVKGMLEMITHDF